MALDLGIRSGKSAAEMSRDERQYLRYPDNLFRRVRDEHGNLRLSKAAKAFHPGQGVYRSSYKNALRLAATETNMAYRTADYLRVQQLDFVVGIQVKLPFFDICDELAGMYPKDFKFVGWHPSCRCYSVKVLKTMDEFLADERRLLNGEALTADSANTVRGMPPQFRQWVLDNRDRIAKARAKGTESYFLRDNKAYVDEILDPKPNALKIAQKRHSERTEAQIRDIQRRWTLRNAEMRHANRTPEQIEAIRKAWEERSVLRNELVQLLNKANVEYREVQRHVHAQSIEEIIARVGGGDLTKGSCSSLAFAYAGNRIGLDVLDFRDGMSRKIFASCSNVIKIAQQTGGIVSKSGNDFKNAKNLLGRCVEGKEYYFACGKHAAIVRKTDSGLEYLELQSSVKNGFKPLNDSVLKERFGAQKSHSLYGTKYETSECLIDLDLLKDNPFFYRLLGYINTEASKQVKGMGGFEK